MQLFHIFIRTENRLCGALCLCCQFSCCYLFNPLLLCHLKSSVYNIILCNCYFSCHIFSLSVNPSLVFFIQKPFVCMLKLILTYLAKISNGCYFLIHAIIMTTGLAGGLLCPYKGLLLALSLKTRRNSSPAATSFTCQALKGLFYLLCFTGSPVNGSIYSFKVIWSYSQSDCI